MKYIINKIVVFNSDELTLFLYENNQVVTKLTKPASRLLLELIQNNKKNITRDDLLERVWTTYGFTASNAGLNNYISELRKAFALLGLANEIIVTIPKLGFRFEGYIDLINPYAEGADITSAAEETAPENRVDESKSAEGGVDSPIKDFLPARRKWLITALGLTGIFMLTVTSLIKWEDSDDAHPYQKIFKFNNCNVYTVGKTESTDDLRMNIEGILNREGIDCLHSSGDVFYIEDRLNKKDVRASLISFCNKNKNNHYDACFNIKNQRNTTK
ncbi:winged helix-turn-helix domain-containing protein [Serratia plymuthica]|jgi:DNA-binding winged helix-turn-helix (wHTH) protein|uniref:winged helix-turn-helix domain-containing protein n=1 Tax=Serratia plymuthica TaxID=82996 RepID=UPI0019283905|nr:winged helix-turn-helix domain-containing protein [Serratia plymuthica]MBL3521202.1 winged helix-turn-helix domain-containing protein [Serratia plymuthica]